MLLPIYLQCQHLQPLNVTIPRIAAVAKELLYRVLSITSNSECSLKPALITLTEIYAKVLDTLYFNM